MSKSISFSSSVKLKYLDGYFVSYSIKQIGKEFDLLRFGDEFILNIELKSELKIANKLEKIKKQMEINHYYLNFLGKPNMILCTTDARSTTVTIPEQTPAFI